MRVCIYFYMTSLKREEELPLTHIMISGRRFTAIQKRGVVDEERTHSKHFTRLSRENCCGMKATTKRRLDAICSALLLSLMFFVRKGAPKIVLLNTTMSSATCTHADGGMYITTFLSIVDSLKAELSRSSSSFCRKKACNKVSKKKDKRKKSGVRLTATQQT